MKCEDAATSALVLTSVDRNGDPVPGGKRLELPGGEGIKYEVQISNSCADPGECAPATVAGSVSTEGTDFRFYYDLINDPARDRKFDLRLVERSQNPRVPIPGFANLGLSCSPQACHAACGRKMTALPPF
jgi:hypothetical protein